MPFVKSAGVFMKGQFKAYTHTSDEILGSNENDVADPEPSGRRNKVFEEVLGLSDRSIDVVGRSVRSLPRSFITKSAKSGRLNYV